ncbi:hypothetical protein LCGC14_1923780, partial [marine sediment metagenome]
STENKQWTLDHEIIHALRDLGLIRPAEWKALERAAQGRIKDTRARYERLELSEEKLIEEAVADMHADWAVGQLQVKGFIRTAFERIRNFFEALGNALHDAGFQSAGDVFRRIGRGEVGARPATDGGGWRPAQFALRPGDFDPKAARRAVKFDNEESEKRWQEARKGVSGDSGLADVLASE